MNNTSHEHYMQLAIEEAAKGVGGVNPNPLVGAIIVRDGTILARGYHAAYGAPHAERNALAACEVSPEGATIYVTLEPCSHHGKTPPCTDALIASGITTAVVATVDPNPKVAGAGIEALKEAGIEVIEGVLEAACREQNRVFFHYIQTGTPYVVMKYAMTLDGKIATHTGHSQWITGAAARERVQRDRQRYAAIMAGVGTVLADDPLLTCRIKGARTPIRIICDTSLRTPLDSQIVKTAAEVPTLIATCEEDPLKHAGYLEAHCELLVVPKETKGSRIPTQTTMDSGFQTYGNQQGDRLCLSALMTELGSRGIDGILLEGGGTLNWAMLAGGHVNLVQAYIAPKLFGGDEAPSPLRGHGVEQAGEAFSLKNTTIERIGEDFLVEGEVQ